ncbi:MAG: hypothetical protein WDO68_26350 [Gammaproteobacteria bacterium]
MCGGWQYSHLAAGDVCRNREHLAHADHVELERRQKLEIQDVRRVTGSCRNSVVGFSGSEILLKPGLMVRWSETGELSAAVGAKALAGRAENSGRVE